MRKIIDRSGLINKLILLMVFGVFSGCASVSHKNKQLSIVDGAKKGVEAGMRMRALIVGGVQTQASGWKPICDGYEAAGFGSNHGTRVDDSATQWYCSEEDSGVRLLIAKNALKHDPGWVPICLESGE